MRRLRILLCAIAPAWALGMLAPAVAPADDFFLEVEGVPGDSTNEKFINAIDVQSFSWGVESARRRAARFQDFQFTKRLDRSSPRLLELVASGEVVPTARLTAVKSGGGQQQYFRLCFGGVLFTSLSGSASNSSLPTESVSFSYSTIVERYSPQRPDGTLDTPVLGGWDLLNNMQYRANC